MPESISYDDNREMITVGDGQFGPAPREVWEYAVGGKNVIQSWFNYRKKDPGGKKTSPLDHDHATTWDPDWTTEFIDLLTVLTRLTVLEPDQRELLTDILAGSLLSAADLRVRGAQWAASQKNRKPHYSLEAPRSGTADGIATLLSSTE